MYKRFASIFIITGICICFIFSCSSSPRYKRGGLSVRPSSKIHKKRSRFSDSEIHALRGVASYYGSDFHGKKTASGEQFDMYDLTAAHRTLPFNTLVKVTNLENNKSVVVRINDRGPFKKGRIVDLSLGAAKKINLIETGTAEVKLEIKQ